MVRYTQMKKKCYHIGQQEQQWDKVKGKKRDACTSCHNKKDINTQIFIYVYMYKEGSTRNKG